MPTSFATGFEFITLVVIFRENLPLSAYPTLLMTLFLKLTNGIHINARSQPVTTSSNRMLSMNLRIDLAPVDDEFGLFRTRNLTSLLRGFLASLWLD